MIARRVKMKMVMAVAALGFSVFGINAYAGPVSIDLEKEFSGGANPAGTAPWANATFVDTGADEVTLTLKSLLEDSDEFITEWDLNFNPGKDVSVLSAGTPGVTAGSFGIVGIGPSFGTNAFKADGDGYFDIKFDFASGPPNDRFNLSDIMTIVFSGTGITAADFNYPSVDGPVGKNGFLSAAHVQGIGPNASLSGWIGDGGGGGGGNGGGGGSVPEPATLALVGLGLLGVAAARRRLRI